jgi:proton-coupled amino acid transporter
VTNGTVTAFLLDHADEYRADVLVTLASLLVSLAVLGTYGLTVFPCIELWCQAKERKDRGDTLEPVPEEDDWWGGSLAYGPYDTPTLRLSLVALTVIAAVAVPKVNELIGLAGALAGASTALIIPPLLELHFAEQDSGKTGLSWIKLRTYFLLILGITFGIVGTVAAVYDIYEAS